MTMAEKKISIVIPCLNEADSIPLVIPHLLLCLKSWRRIPADSFEIIVIDDGSTDNSADLLAQYPEVRIFRHQKSCGYGGALKSGFREAKGQYISFFDLDRTYDPADLESLYEALLQSNGLIIFGDRMSEHNQMPRLRKLGNLFYALVIQYLYNIRLNDVCTGMRIFKKDLVQEILKIEENGLHFSIAFTVLILNKRALFTQKRIRYHERLGRSKLSVIKDGFKFLYTIFKYYRKSSE